MRKTEYRVYYTDDYGNPHCIDHDDMSCALKDTQKLRNARYRFVTMVSENVDMVGQLGVSDVDENYEWKKDYSIKRRYKRGNS